MFNIFVQTFHALYMHAASCLLTFYAYTPSVKPETEQKIKVKIDRILSSKEFAKPVSDDKGLLQKSLEKLWNAIVDFFERLGWQDKPQSINPGDSMSLGNNLFLKTFGLIIVTAVLLLIFYFVLKNFRNSRRIKIEEDIELITTLKEPDYLELKALKYFKQGDLNQGLRHLYIASLLCLNEQNIIKIEKSKTNKQYLNEIFTNKEELYSKYLKFTQDFNRHWYGNRAVPVEKFEYWHKEYRDLRKEN